MTGLEGAGVAGELMSWIGLLLGLPLLMTGLALRSRERALVPTEVVIVDQQYGPWARWYASGEFHERPLLHPELARSAGREFCTGYVSRRDSSRMRLELRSPFTRVSLALGATFTAIGLCGLVVSVLPMVIA